MKKLFSLSLAIILLFSCKESVPELIVFERFYAEYTNEVQKVTLSVDVPVSGPAIVRDSLNAFIDSKLRKICDLREDSSSGDFETRLGTISGSSIAKEYLESYKAIFDKLLEWDMFLSFTVIAQTDSFITYGLGYSSCGLGCASSYYCYTFSKENGHLVKDVVKDNAKESIVALCRNKDKQGYFPPVDSDNWYFGLGQPDFLVINHIQSHYVIWDADYSAVLPYLSEEASELIDSKGKPYRQDEWLVGEICSVIERDNGATIYLMQRELLGNEVISEDVPFETVELVAMQKEGDKYTPVDVFSAEDGEFVSTLSFTFPGIACDQPEFGHFFFKFDKEDFILLAPFFDGEASILLREYKFDGKRFFKTSKTRKSFDDIEQ